MNLSPHTTTPRWVLATLAAVMLGAGAIYTSGIPLGMLHNYYSPAVYTMSESWSAWWWGAFDTAESITMDKLPLAFQVQALSARVFGFSEWSVLMPQVLAAVATIGMLFATVRRWAGWAAGLLAATAYAAMPIVAALSHTQIVDTLLTLFVVSAAYTWTRAVQAGRLMWLVATGALVGLAFNVKMAQAWGVLPALGLAYLLFAPGTWLRRGLHLVAATATTLLVSLHWVLIAELIPASSRPWIDGSASNSAWDMVFGYNLLDRYDGSATGPGATTGDSSLTDTIAYLFQSDIATQMGWLFPTTVLGLVAVAFARSQPDARLLRAGGLMWGVWLATFAVAFSTGRVAHTFYVVALAPPVAALSAVWAVTAWKAWQDRRPDAWLLPAGIVATAAWTLWLLRSYTEFHGWLTPTVVAATVVSVGVLAWQRMRGAGRRLVAAAGVAALVASLATPVVWAASTSQREYAGMSIGPVAGPVSDGARSGGPSGAGPGGGGPGGLGDGGPGDGPAMAGGRPDGDRPMPPGGQPANGQPMGGPPGAQGASVAPGQSGGPGAMGMNGKMGMGAGASAEPNTELAEWLSANDSGTTHDLVLTGNQGALPVQMAGISTYVVGGFTGSMPNLTADELAALVSSGEARYVLVSADSPGGGMRGPGDQRDQGAPVGAIQGGAGQGGTGQGGTGGGDAATSDSPGGDATGDGGPGRRAATNELKQWVEAECTAVDDAPASGLYDCAP